MAYIKSSLNHKPGPATQGAIADILWGSSPRKDTLDAYWIFYNEQCESALRENGQHIQSRKHEDLLDIVELLNADQGRNEVRMALRNKFTLQHINEDELVDNSIDLAACLLLMIDFSDIQFGYSGRQRLSWEDGSLRDCVRTHFSSMPVLGHEGTRLPRIFNAVSLERVAGVSIVPTNNLLDHLRLTHDDTILHVFHNASFLRRQSQESLLPLGLAQETLNTLALLYPSDDTTIRRWVRQTAMKGSIDPHVAKCGYLKTDDRQIEKFEYWHDQLVVLKQVFDEATPRTISQWWYDRRNGVQWYTFWVAVVVLCLTLLFGLIQSIEGALQVYGTFYWGKNA